MSPSWLYVTDPFRTQSSRPFHLCYNFDRLCIWQCCNFVFHMVRSPSVRIVVHGVNASSRLIFSLVPITCIFFFLLGLWALFFVVSAISISSQWPSVDSYRVSLFVLLCKVNNYVHLKIELLKQTSSAYGSECKRGRSYPSCWSWNAAFWWRLCERWRQTRWAGSSQTESQVMASFQQLPCTCDDLLSL